jgi:DNA recombination protein RmuC
MRTVELAARVQQMGELLARAQSQLQATVNDRLDAVTQHLGTSMQTATRHTAENLQKLNERLAVIDHAQKNLTELASQVTSLRDVLSNKQTRGAFGQGRMEAIIEDGLPKGSYEFQHTLKNGKRPDCVVLLPDQRPLVIDAKFPLEAVTAFRDGKTEDERKYAAARVRQDVMKHVNDIAGKYLCPGETQDVALMFVPSESVYAELHDSFDDVVQKAYRAQVMMVSPTLLMLAIQVIQQIQKDSRMREAADTIRTEVGAMMKDVRLLGERVRKLQTHFGQASEDLNTILTSAGRIERRAGRIEELDFDGPEAPAADTIGAPARKIEAAE